MQAPVQTSKTGRLADKRYYDNSDAVLQRDRRKLKAHAEVVRTRIRHCRELDSRLSETSGSVDENIISPHHLHADFQLPVSELVEPPVWQNRQSCSCEHIFWQ